MGYSNGQITTLTPMTQNTPDTTKPSPLIGFGQRIKEERLRLNMTQAEFGELGGVIRVTQSNYESEGREPGICYLISLLGKVDVGYILAGQREGIAGGRMKIEPAMVENILNEIDNWAIEKKGEIPLSLRAELLALFLEQALSTGAIQAEWIKQTLHLIK